MAITHCPEAFPLEVVMLEISLRVPHESKSEPNVVVEQRIVQGDAARGKHPYVIIDRVNYTNEALASMPAAIGRKILVRIDPSEMRTVHGRFESGEDIGTLAASGEWSRHHHTRAIRKAINSLHDVKARSVPESHSSLEAFVRSKKEKRSKKPAAS
jgi:hypothetical protein